MGEYISKDALMKAFVIRVVHGTSVPEWNDAIDIAESIPAADVVPVVRCRECYFRALDGADVPVCTGAMAYSYTPDDWFCAGGKPKAGGQDE